MTIADKTHQRTIRFQGLSPTEVEASRQKYGSNVLTPPERDAWWKLFLEKFEDPIIRILMVAAVIAIAIGIVEGSCRRYRYYSRNSASDNCSISQ